MGALKRGAYTPGQRPCFLYAPVATGIFAVTGTFKWLRPDVVGKQAIGTASLIHVGITIVTDVLLVLHI